MCMSRKNWPWCHLQARNMNNPTHGKTPFRYIRNYKLRTCATCAWKSNTEGHSTALDIWPSMLNKWPLRHCAKIAWASTVLPAISSKVMRCCRHSSIVWKYNRLPIHPIQKTATTRFWIASIDLDLDNDDLEPSKLLYSTILNLCDLNKTDDTEANRRIKTELRTNTLLKITHFTVVSPEPQQWIQIMPSYDSHIQFMCSVHDLI